MSKFRLVVLVVAACLSGMIIDHHLMADPPSEEIAASGSDNLYIWYAGYNDQYFGDKLPRDPIISHEKSAPDEVAHTEYNASQKRFHIVFNTMYPIGERMEHLALQHEMCHIETPEPTEQVAKDGGHGPEWRTCMLKMEAMGAWRDLLIDGYKGQ